MPIPGTDASVINAKNAIESNVLANQGDIANDSILAMSGLRSKTSNASDRWNSCFNWSKLANWLSQRPSWLARSVVIPSAVTIRSLRFQFAASFNPWCSTSP